jgi:uncharacterized protein
VSRLAVAPVKSCGLVAPHEITLEASGVAENRRFYLVDEEGRLLNGTRCPSLAAVVPCYDRDSGRLALAFPDGSLADGDVALGPPVETLWGARSVTGRLVEGPWADALSRFLGQPVRLVRAEWARAASSHTPVSLLSDASVDRLARHAGKSRIDARRFRMLVGIDGCEPHDEDAWIGRRVTVGEAVVRVVAATARCVVTTRDPDTGIRDLDTLRLIKEVRGVTARRTLDLGVYGEVERPGTVRVGDPVVPR